MPPSKSAPSRTVVLCSLSLVAVAVSNGCQDAPSKSSVFPPKDFALDMDLAEVVKGRERVLQSVRLDASGRVIYRESASSLRSADGSLTLPVFRRMCAYRLHWRMIRLLTRELHTAPIDEISQIPNPDPGDEYRRIRFHLVFNGRNIDQILENRVLGVMNQVLRVTNSYLPDEGGFTLPQMLGEALASRCQDVPAIQDSVKGALHYHLGWLKESPLSGEVLGDAFALACAAGDFTTASSLLPQIDSLRSADAAAFRQILVAGRAAAGAGPGPR